MATRGIIQTFTVAPLAGAWVEMRLPLTVVYRLSVAPLAGAWVEIGVSSNCQRHRPVAPLAGAWVEILSGCSLARSFLGRSPRGSVG